MFAWAIGWLSSYLHSEMRIFQKQLGLEGKPRQTVCIR